MFAKLIAVVLAVSGIIATAPAAYGPCSAGSYRCDPTHIAIEICDLYVASAFVEGMRC
jgi:hypothetical protein